VLCSTIAAALLTVGTRESALLTLAAWSRYGPLFAGFARALPITLAAQLCSLRRDSCWLAVSARKRSLLVGADVIAASVHLLGRIFVHLRGRLTLSL
jgi:hypothetical protein